MVERLRGEEDMGNHEATAEGSDRFLAGLILIRLAVGLIFFTQGILKFTDPNMGILRFTRIGFPVPGFTAYFVGAFEIVCGLLVLLGLWTRLAAAPLLIVISTAIATTKLPELFREHQGFWYMVSDARTDFAMLCSLLFLILAGGGRWSLDARLRLGRGREGRPASAAVRGLAQGSPPG
jgi:putative oxidoreductase